MRAPKMLWITWSTVAIVTVLRALFAARLPLTGDEAYYWEWSRRLAAGYADHPPAVAFCIAAFSWIGRTPLAVRAAFVLCGVLTALFTAGAAARLARDARAGAVAALAVTLAPMMIVAFGSATPDGPYAVSWAAALYFAVRAFEERKVQWFAALGVALGAALLSRIFGWAFVAGIIGAALVPRYRGVWRAGLGLALGIALLLYVPYIWWNAQHNWIAIRFALLQRHPSDEVELVRPFVLYGLSALAFSPGLWLAATVAAVRIREALVLWTALPFGIALFVLSIHERVEVYWFIGPFISLAVACGCAYVQWPAQAARARAAYMFAPAALLSALMFAAGIAPGPVYAALRAGGLHLSDGGPFEMFTYQPLARDVARITRSRDAIAMTDGYGFSSLLDFYAGLTPVVIGYDPQGEEAKWWYTGPASRALFVDKVPLQKRADFVAQLSRACGRVVPGPVLSYTFVPDDPRVPPRRYYTTWCEQMGPDSIATLRWLRGRV